MRFLRLIAMPFLVFALPLGAQAKEDALTLRIISDDGQIKFLHHGKRLKDSTMEQLCAAARRDKIEIEFQRDKMTGNDALASILKEAQCLGATHIGFTGIDRYPEPKSAPHRHATPRHRAAAPR